MVPAIDIRAGRVVRLRQGRLQEETVYGSDPCEAARGWEGQGAERIHLVDLDAAIEGKPQPEVIGAVIAAVKIPVEVGGGLRVLETAMRYREGSHAFTESYEVISVANAYLAAVIGFALANDNSAKKLKASPISSRSPAS